MFRRWEGGGRNTSLGECDVVVVGGGPAGSATAISCARNGLNVILLEDQKAVPSPGETLHPGVEPLMRQLGLADWIDNHAGFLRHEGHWSSWGAEPSFVRFGSDEDGPWRGYQAHRPTFDARLLARAAQDGVQIERRSAGLHPIVEGDQVTGVLAPIGAIRSRFVVDATGGRHWLARRLGTSIQTRSPRLTAWFGYYHGEFPNRDDAPQIQGDQRGWTWTARVAPSRYHWTRLHLHGDKPHRPEPPTELLGLEPAGRTRAADVTWRMVSRCAGHGYFIVGDAAWVLDPVSSHGVLKALMSGLYAANCIYWMAHGVDRKDIAEAYTSWMARWFEHDLLVLRKLYFQLPRPPAWL